jgi:hypothetical protein
MIGQVRGEKLKIEDTKMPRIVGSNFVAEKQNDAFVSQY